MIVARHEVGLVLFIYLLFILEQLPCTNPPIQVLYFIAIVYLFGSA